MRGDVWFFSSSSNKNSNYSCTFMLNTRKKVIIQGLHRYLHSTESSTRQSLYNTITSKITVSRIIIIVVKTVRVQSYYNTSTADIMC